MKKAMNKKLVIILCITVLVSCLSVGVIYAAIDSANSNEIVSDAVKAADVCREHLLTDCPECSIEHPVCPYCEKVMTLCCSGQVAEDDYYKKCLVMDHPSNCNTVQDLYWNAYYCRDCGYFTRGSHDDDYHVEAYRHTKAECYDHALCSLPRLSDLMSVDDKVECSNDDCNSKEKDPIAAADICGVCGAFDCQIYH